MLLSADIRRIIAKELTIFFSSPMAYIFLAAFAAITLFVFFWVESFFSRNISDVRPLFEWMPILLIFLSATLTMRLWSEEKRIGTVEHVLTQPVGIWSFVIGKFIACVVLLLIALLISLPIPISVAFIGDLDWGPVWSGYLATFLLGSAYISIGLFVSARSDNQIVSLISSVLVCGAFYLIGSSVITGLFDSIIGEVLRSIGTGSRFDSITRGIIDIRDFYYYISLIGVGLALNVYVLEKSRWSKKTNADKHRSWHIATVLIVVNILFANVWLSQVNQLRYDTTEGKIYSISKSTSNVLRQLQEPLLIRGYFSAQTHPLLAPLVPQILDLVREYEVAGKGLVKVEIVDPADDPALEDEANNKYSIRPTPFQVADRYQTSVVNSYFDILLQYGNEFKNLSFRDLIEVRQKKETEIDVLLRNPEYDLTNAINKILQAYQSAGSIFDRTKGLKFMAYISEDDKLPDELKKFKGTVLEQIQALEQESNGKLTSEVIAPETNGGAVAEQIARDYGFKPMVVSLADTRQFFFYMLLIEGSKAVVVPIGDLQAGNFEKVMRSAIKRLSSGYTRTVGLYAQPPALIPNQSPLNTPRSDYQIVSEALRTDLNVTDVDLNQGAIGSEVDLLVLLGANELSEKQLFAVDQYLMRGGTIIASASPYTASLSNRSISMKRNKGNFIQWIEKLGLTFDEGIVMDERSAPFPIPVVRKVGGFEFQQIKLLQYPYFSEIREDGLNSADNITNSLKKVVMAWASPVMIDEQSTTHQVVSLLKSSQRAWLSNNTNVVPKLKQDGTSGFEQPTQVQQYHLGASIKGRFDSWFAGKASPLSVGSTDGLSFNNVIERSPESAKIVLFSSSEFLKDRVMQLIGSANRTDFKENITLLKNAVDVSLESEGLQDIRARSNFNRTLPRTEVSEQQIVEYGNYIVALLLLTLIGIGRKIAYRRRLKAYIVATKA